MKFLRKAAGPVELIETELRELGERRALIAAKLAEAEAAFSAAKDARRQAVLDADLSDEDAAARRDRACRDTEDRMTSLTEAAQLLGSRIADAEQRLHAERDRIERDAA